jgi:hypothetical protein
MAGMTTARMTTTNRSQRGRFVPALAAACALWLAAAPHSRAAEFARNDEIPICEPEVVKFHRQGFLDSVTRVLFFGYARTGEGNILPGGVLRVAREKPGPGGEILVTYYRRNAPPGGEGHCLDGTVIEMTESTVRFYLRFYELRERALAGVRASLRDPAERPATDPRGENLAWGAIRPGRVERLQYEAYITTANVDPLRHEGQIVARFGDRYRIDSAKGLDKEGRAKGARRSTPTAGPTTNRKGGDAEAYRRFKWARGFVACFDRETGLQRPSLLWEWSAQEDPTGKSCWQCAPNGTLFMEPDYLGALLAHIHTLFEERALDRMDALVRSIEAAAGEPTVGSAAP